METAVQPSPITTADAPFNDPTDVVDLVIRTTDNVDFFVLSGLLSLRSPSSFFRHALQSNRHTEERDGFPVLRVVEDSTTFRYILLLCYPNDRPVEIKSVEDVVAVRVALEKYCMDYAIGRFEQTVIASSLIREHALRLFVLAFRKGWRKLGEAAAKNTLFIPLTEDVAIEELNDISAMQYVILRDYHRKCSDTARANLDYGKKLFWMEPEDAESLSSSYSYRFNDGYYERTVRIRGTDGERTRLIDQWTLDYIRKVSQKLRETPHPEIATDENIINAVVLSSGNDSIAIRKIQTLAKLLSKEIDRRISEVPLNIKWER
ncbi:uncharacterized protein EV420DRAFT_806458 [Desarmillaria tabescens]|uniref:BTB domain-containing protein n=1 Tax=Armillaria tabescens TaxID=1929756 RepID=A0AA39NI09_ARMTA|nr:uncharacterized protein EV420DRAFT_806458 [Desarmillaria tabescens]KAK0466015.1 hypothetical protein EV420DRAFT_806458 [Desarmillaria tabescens]